MSTCLEQILNSINTLVGFTGSIITIFDHFKNKGVTYIEELNTAIRNKSKTAYDLYCEYCEHRNNDIGVPLEGDILGYWESCVKRDTLPSVEDMRSSNIASREEAEIMLAYLLEAWMEIPDFVAWLHDMLAQKKLDELSIRLSDLQKNMEGISDLANELKQQNISNTAFLISPNRIVDAKYSCTDLDIKHYYMVDNRFPTMFKVISAKQDIPHEKAVQKLKDLAEGCQPVIIAGNGGLGKTSLMLHTAVQWASRGRVAVWLSLSSEDVITEQKAEAFFRHLSTSIPAGQRGLLCIDNPYEGKVSFSNLQKMWPDNGKIQLIMAERSNRLTLLSDPDQDNLLYWFDDAQMIILQGEKKKEWVFELKDYVSYQFSEIQERRKKILEKCTLFLVKEGIVKEEDRQSNIQTVLEKYGKPSISLVELIYRTLFELKKRASKPEAIKLDWNEWQNFIESEFGEKYSYASKELYGVIAALKVFNSPITIPFFCKYFDFNERKLKIHLSQRLMSRHTEPVIIHNNTILPKHDVIAELFFLFHKTISINSLMLDLLQCMNEDEIETLLANMVTKREFQKGRKYHVGQIHYRDYMDVIYERMCNHTCNLSEPGKAYLCLGYLWSRFQKNLSEGKNASLNDILNTFAPEIDGTLIMQKLYTEWGIWEHESGAYTKAEEKFKSVIENYPTSLPARTELGRLLSKQKGREKEAEEILREAMGIKTKDIQSRTELGRLLSKQKGREKEAEEILREVIRIDSKNIMSRTELGRLLSKQKGREKEAEEILREAMGIKTKDIQSRTELGRLLSKQKGREKEAEEILREVIRIDSKNLHARTVLAKLFEDENRKKEAVVLYQEVLKYDHGNFFAKRGLERLKEYIEGENE